MEMSNEKHWSETKKLRKILIIANLYHASPRIPALCKFLPENGWEPTIITPRLANLETVFNAPSKDVLAKIRLIEIGEPVSFETKKNETPFRSRTQRGLKRTIMKIDSNSDQRLSRALEMQYWRLYHVMNYPDPNRSWCKPALMAAKGLTENESFDLLLSSSSPIVTHLVAKDVHEQCGIPWIAELRDLWSQNHNLHMGKLMKTRTERLERDTLKGASILVTVSPTWAQDLISVHGSKEVRCITNGYDPQSYSSQPCSKTKNFTITYTGQIYRGKQDPSKFLMALKQAMEGGLMDSKNVEFRLFGPGNDTVTRLASELGLTDRVTQYGVVTRQASLDHQCESQLLLLMNWDEEGQFGVIPLKLFEYMGSGTPIIVTGGKPGDEVSKIIEETRCGACEYSLQDLVRTLSSYYAEWSKKGAIHSDRDDEMVDKYSFRNLSHDYSKVFDEAIAQNAGS